MLSVYSPQKEEQREASNQSALEEQVGASIAMVGRRYMLRASTHHQKKVKAQEGGRRRLRLALAALEEQATRLENGGTDSDGGRRYMLRASTHHQKEGEGAGGGSSAQASASCIEEEQATRLAKKAEQQVGAPIAMVGRRSVLRTSEGWNIYLTSLELALAS